MLKMMAAQTVAMWTLRLRLLPDDSTLDALDPAVLHFNFHVQGSCVPKDCSHIMKQAPKSGATSYHL